MQWTAIVMREEFFSHTILFHSGHSAKDALYKAFDLLREDNRSSAVYVSAVVPGHHEVSAIAEDGSLVHSAK